MRLRRIISGLFALLLGLVLSWLVVFALQPPVLPIGADAPEVEFNTPNGEKCTLHGTRLEMVVLVNNRCEYCRYQLQLLNDNLQAFDGVQIYLLSPEDDVRQQDANKDYPRLRHSSRIVRASLAATDIKQHFGPMTTPAFYIFKNGMLKVKFQGETRLEKWLNYLDGAKQ